MKIAMIIEAWTPIWGGGQAVAYEIAKRLTEMYDIDIDLFVMNLEGYNGEIVEQINKNFRIVHVGKKRKWDFKNRLIWIWELIRTIIKFNNKTRYNILHAHSILPGVPGKFLSLFFKIPIVYQVHGFSVEAIEDMYGKGIKSKFLNFLENIINRKIKYNTEITVDRKFLDYSNINKPVYIPNGVDIDNFDKYSFKGEDFFKILFVGRIHPQKGLIYLIKASKLIKEELINKKAKIVIIGDGYQKDDLIFEIKKLGIEDLFEFRGEKSGINLIKEYKSSNLFILPSLYEGFPLTILESWSSKLPVLVSNVGELPYIIQDEFNGWLFEKENIQDLKEKMVYILNKDIIELRNVGINGYFLTKEKYDWNFLIDYYYKIYMNIK